MAMSEHLLDHQMTKSSKLKKHRMVDLVDLTKTHEDYPKPEDWGRVGREAL